MVSYMTNPQIQLTIAGTVIDGFQSAVITRLENGFDSGTIFVSDLESKNWPSPITSGTTVKLEVKDATDASYTTLLEGLIRQCTPKQSVDGDTLELKCDGAGYGLGETVCGEEYGSESALKTLDTLTEIVTDATKGVVPNWVNKILGGAASGYSYTTTSVETINNIIKYVYFPYKKCNKTLDDVCDLVTALQAGSAGPHWIVTPTADLRIKLITGTQVGWTKYYGDSQANATLVHGVDFKQQEFPQLDIEANYILYYGNWRRPGNGDSWTENNSGLWGHDAVHMELDDSAVCKVGSYSLRINSPDSAGGYFWYPSAQTSNWDLTKVESPNHVPTINFYFRRSGAVPAVGVMLCTTDLTNNYNYDFAANLVNANEWYHFSWPIGNYWATARDSTNFKWTKINNPDWANIDFIAFAWSAGNTIYGYLDGLHIGNVPICRVAKKSDATIASQKLRVKLITDDIGKDDSLVASDDSGPMAQFAYSELLKSTTTPILATISTSMIKDLLPGQWLHIHGKKKADGTFAVDKDMRVPRLRQIINNTLFFTEIDLTDDLTNSHARQAFNDLNTVLAATRPEFQDRQASNIKAGQIDITVPRLVKEY